MSAALIKLKVDTIRHPEAFYHDLRLWQPPTRPKSKSKYMRHVVAWTHGLSLSWRSGVGGTELAQSGVGPKGR